MINKLQLWLGGVLVVISAAACAQFGQLVNYTIGEDELERLMLAEVNKQDYRINVPGLSADLDINTLALDLDRNGDGKAHVQADTTVNASLFGRQYPVRVNLAVAGIPSYDATEHAIFVRNLTLEDSTVETGMGQLNVGGISDDIYQLLHDWLNENPVYRFDQSDSRYQLLQQFGLQVVVEPGQLRIKSNASNEG